MPKISWLSYATSWWGRLTWQATSPGRKPGAESASAAPHRACPYSTLSSPLKRAYAPSTGCLRPCDDSLVRLACPAHTERIVRDLPDKVRFFSEVVDHDSGFIARQLTLRFSVILVTAHTICLASGSFAKPSLSRDRTKLFKIEGR